MKDWVLLLVLLLLKYLSSRVVYHQLESQLGLGRLVHPNCNRSLDNGTSGSAGRGGLK